MGGQGRKGVRHVKIQSLSWEAFKEILNRPDKHGTSHIYKYQTVQKDRNKLKHSLS